jgi:glycosyltransferase involved in cell wall biosynthesis
MEETLKRYPRISIVTPCFNSEKYLESTINSVLGQQYPNLEYIIIDGGSTDATIDIIKKYERDLSYWISEKDNGIYDALNKGFAKMAGGETDREGGIMSWIGSDDLYHPKAFWTIAEIFSSFQEIQWLVGPETTYDEQGRTTNVQESQRFTRYDFLDGDYRLQQESCFWRRSVWEAAGARLDASLKYAGDFELWIRFFRHAKLHVTNALIGGFRQRSANQLSLDGYDMYLAESARIAKAEKLTPEEQRQFSEFRRFKRLMRLMEKMKIFNTERIFNKYKNIKYGDVKTIRFDRMKQAFEYGP